MRYLTKLNLLSLSFISILSAHGNIKVVDFQIFQDIKLACDFHTHTVSDGSVWPDIRVQEALKDQLDAIAMTEHLEIQNYKDDILIQIETVL